MACPHIPKAFLVMLLAPLIQAPLTHSHLLCCWSLTRDLPNLVFKYFLQPVCLPPPDPCPQSPHSPLSYPMRIVSSEAALPLPLLLCLCPSCARPGFPEPHIPWLLASFLLLREFPGPPRLGLSATSCCSLSWSFLSQ